MKKKNLNCGTHEVEKYSQALCNQNVRKGRNDRLVSDVMKHNVDDSKFDEKEIRKQLVSSRIEYIKAVKRGCMADLIFNRMMKYKVEKVWIDGKIKNMRKVETLLKR